MRSKWLFINKKRLYAWLCLHKKVSIKTRLTIYRYDGMITYSFVTPILQVGLSRLKGVKNGSVL